MPTPDIYLHQRGQKHTLTCAEDRRVTVFSRAIFLSSILDANIFIWRCVCCVFCFLWRSPLYNILSIKGFSSSTKVISNSNLVKGEQMMTRLVSHLIHLKMSKKKKRGEMYIHFFVVFVFFVNWFSQQLLMMTGIMAMPFRSLSS